MAEDGGVHLPVFVYGTLMPGQPRWRHLRPYAAGWRRATAAGGLWDTGRGYPAACFDSAGGPVPGFLVTLAEDMAEVALRRLDEIEAEGSLYRRLEISTSEGPALSYEWLGSTDGLRLLPGGWPERSG